MTGSTVAVLWFIFSDHQLYMQRGADNLALPLQARPPIPMEDIAYLREIGRFNGHPCLVVELAATPEAHGLQAVTLREAHTHLGDALWTIAGRASQVLHWRRDHRFCGRCGNAMQEEQAELLCRCPACDFSTYPRLSPAVIMSVVDGDRILLGRAPHYPTDMYSVLAGFVEPGETLEQAVAREVLEETAIEVTDIRYFASQPWPFPHSLMVGFTARYGGGTLKIDHTELEDAGWFTADQLPRLPSPISISRRLIDQFLREHGG